MYLWFFIICYLGSFSILARQITNTGEIVIKKDGKDVLVNWNIKKCQLTLYNHDEHVATANLSFEVPIILEYPTKALVFAESNIPIFYSSEENLNMDFEIIQEESGLCWNRRKNRKLEKQIESLENKTDPFKVPVSFFRSNPALKDIVQCPNTKCPIYQAKVAIIDHGHKSLAARKTLINSAQKSIFYKTYEFFGDISGQEIAKDLIYMRKVKHLDVKVMVDAFPFWIESNPLLKINTSNMFNNLMAAGIKVHGYSCKGDFFKREMLLEKGGLAHINYRYHEKSLVVDYEDPKAVAIIGGMNSGDQYFRIGLEKWQDTDLLLKGKIAQEIGNSFLTDWGLENKREVADFSCLNTYTPGTDDYNKFYRQEYRDYVHPTTVDDKAQTIFSKFDLFNSQLAKKEFEPIYNKAQVHYIKSSPKLGQKHDKNPIENMYINLITSAKSEILLTNMYFIPSRKFILALTAALARGVDIRIVTNSAYSNSQRAPVYFARVNYKKIRDPFYSNNKLFSLKPAKIFFQKKMQENLWKAMEQEFYGEAKIFEFLGTEENILSSRAEFDKFFVKEEEIFMRDARVHPGTKKKIMQKVKGRLRDIFNGDKKGIRLLHSKYAIFDRRFVITGSYNIDPRSRNFNREHVAVADSHDLAADFVSNFQKIQMLSLLVDHDKLVQKNRSINPFSRIKYLWMRMFRRYY